jgi:hypothetical protein
MSIWRKFEIVGAFSLLAFMIGAVLLSGLGKESPDCVSATSGKDLSAFLNGKADVYNGVDTIPHP